MIWWALAWHGLTRASERLLEWTDRWGAMLWGAMLILNIPLVMGIVGTIGDAIAPGAASSLPAAVLVAAAMAAGGVALLARGPAW